MILSHQIPQHILFHSEWHKKCVFGICNFTEKIPTSWWSQVIRDMKSLLLISVLLCFFYLPHIRAATVTRLVLHQWPLIWHELDHKPHLIRLFAGVVHLVRIFNFFFTPFRYFMTETAWNYDRDPNAFCHCVTYGWNYMGNKLLSVLLETLWKASPQEPPEEAPLWTFLGYKVLKRQKYWCQV